MRSDGGREPSQPAFVQREHLRYEPVIHYVENLNKAERAALQVLDIETCFMGRGSKKAAEKALRLIKEQVARG